MEQLKEQIGKLTEQVAALTTASLRTTNREQRRCFACNRMGHMQRDCPFRRQGSEGSSVLHMQQTRPLGQRVPPGKRPRGVCQEQWVPLTSTVSSHSSMVTVAATKSRVTGVEVMLDSGSSVSLVQQQVLLRVGGIEQI